MAVKPKTTAPDFNPRSLTGATHVAANDLAVMCKFQSTLPYGSDWNCFAFRGYISQFQSTLPYGSDCADVRRERPAVISIHAPLRERQKTTANDHDAANISIHAPLRERLNHQSRWFGHSQFQSTLPYGSDTKSHFIVIHCYDFNPRSLTGATATSQESGTC